MYPPCILYHSHQNCSDSADPHFLYPATYLICRRGTHEWHSIVLSPEQSPDGVHTTLEKKTAKALFICFYVWRHRIMTNSCQSGIAAEVLTLIGVYHLFSFCWTTGGGLLGGRWIIGSSESSGIVTVAFLAFSSLAPSSVEPFSPQRTWRHKN